MQKTAHRFTDSDTSLGISELDRHAQGWLLDGEIRQLSPNTLYARRLLVEKLLWFLRQRKYPTCGTLELRHFLAYIGNGHEDPNGRWGNAQLRKGVRPRTVQTYFINMKTLFGWLVDEGVLEVSPMGNLRPPVARMDQIQPFTQAQVSALLAAAKRSHHPRRDLALLLILLDTGVRASEVCGLRMKDLDMPGRRATVLGKGNKRRSVYFGRDTTKALWTYLKEQERGEEDPLFFSDRGTRKGEAITRSGLRQLLERLGQAAKIEATRCSPHTCRHTFAVEFLRGGGNVFSLQQLLGHTSLHMTNRYVALAQADIEAQHRAYSPVDRLRGRR